jgi:lipoyl(octanoyl) transferase
MPNTVEIHDLGLQDYTQTHQRMLSLNENKASFTNQIWLLEHPPVFTQGFNGDDSHILKPTDIPIVRTDRGGQITYHGPGQLILYPLIDLRNNHIMPLELVTLLEETTIKWLAECGIDCFSDKKDRGVYHKQDGKKIASIGVRIKNGRSYHGIAINIDMDLSPFEIINPCGILGMKMTQVYDIIEKKLPNRKKIDLAFQLASALNLDPKIVRKI